MNSVAADLFGTIEETTDMPRTQGYARSSHQVFVPGAVDKSMVK